MIQLPATPSDIAFSPTVKAIQARKGSRAAYARLEQGGGWDTKVTEDLADFIARQRSFFLATANAQGQPYIQHRGGPPGFLRVLDPSTLGFADFRGNRQYITLGNLEENPRVHLFLIDYVDQSRIKIWGEARAVEGDDALVASLVVPGYVGRPERAIVVTITAWDVNCQQHIPRRFEAQDVEAQLEAKDREIIALQAELAALRAKTPR